VRVSVESDRISAAGRAAHDMGLGAILGGNVFGRLAMHLEDGDHTSAEATDAEAMAKRRLNVLGALNLASALALTAVNSTLAQKNFRRPPLRRVLKRSY
jgi:hypothetical protein